MSDAAQIPDFQAPFDPTGYITITGAQLLQLIVAAQPYIDKGLVVVVADSNGVPLPPDANTTTKWVNYLWLRVIPNTSTVVLYAWNPNATNNIVYSDGTGQTIESNWIPVVASAIPPGSITGSLIANNTILPGNINLSLLATALGFNPTTTVTTATSPAAGDISGTYAAGFTIGAGKVLTAMITDLAITGAKIAAATIDYTKLIGDGTAGDMLKSTGTPAIAPIWFTPLQITTGLANPNSGGTDDNKLVAVNSGAAGTFKYVVSPVLQVKYASATTTTSSSGNITDSNTHGTSDTGMTAATGISIAITPTSTSNYLIVEAQVSLLAPAGNNAIWAYLFSSASAVAPIAACAINVGSNGGALEGQVTLRAKVTTPGTSALTYSVYFGQVTAGTGKVNNKSETSSIMVTEYSV